MKTTRLTMLFLTGVLSGLILCASYGQSLTSLNPLKNNKKAKEVMQDNEFERNEIGQAENIYCNPLVLNEQSLDYGNFTITTTGQLTLVKGDPKSKEATTIPFFIRLRRAGKIIDMEFSRRELYKIEVSKVLAFGQPGDQLIIEPANKEDWKAKRILKIVM